MSPRLVLPLALLLLLLPLSAASGSITSLGQLQEALQSKEAASVGFLSEANYEAVASAVPKRDKDGGPLRVVIFEHAKDLEAAVNRGDVLAGLMTSPPAGEFFTFGAGIVTMRAAMTKPGNTRMRQLLDASIVRNAADGTWQRIEFQYWKSNRFDSVSAWTCPATPDRFAFPPNPPVTTLRMGMLGTAAGGPPDWGYQGKYAEGTGLWPDIEAAIVKALPGGAVRLERRFFNSSAAVMDAVLAGDVDCTAPYWTVSGFHRDRIRHASLDVGCTVLGTESTFFTRIPPAACDAQAVVCDADQQLDTTQKCATFECKATDKAVCCKAKTQAAAATPAEDAASVRAEGPAPTGTVGLVVLVLALVVTTLVVVLLVVCEKRGTPIFRTPLLTPADRQDKGKPSAKPSAGGDSRA